VLKIRRCGYARGDTLHNALCKVEVLGVLMRSGYRCRYSDLLLAGRSGD
jgi:hypothetical protein